MTTTVFSYGRMNPITIGHAVLVDSLERIAKEHGVEPRLILTESHDKKNPLTPQQKVKWAEIFFPDVDVDTFRGNIFDLVEKLTEGGDDAILVVGSDRVDEFSDRFKSITGMKVVSGGTRDNSDSAKGASATKMREAVATDDIEAFIKLCPGRLNDEMISEYFIDIKSGLDKFPGRKKKTNECVLSIMGDLLEIVDRRTNYILGINEAGEFQKWFNDQITPTEDQIVYPEGTFRGIPIPESITENELDIMHRVEPYATLKYLMTVNEGKDGTELLNKIQEAVTTQAQNSALDLIADTFGVQKSNTNDPKRKLTDLQTRMKTKSLGRVEKSTYNKMLNSLSDLDLPVSIDKTAIK